MDDCDFSGFATRPNRKCSDGRTITAEAFKHMNGTKLPLVWQHGHDDINNVLGHVLLEHRGDDGTYAYGFFNETDAGQNAKLMVKHGDLDMMSIFANQLVEKSKTVLHGQILEVSLVLAGANPDARIDYVRVAHSADSDDYTLSTDEALMVMGDKLEHGVEDDFLEHRTYEDVLATLNEEQEELFAVMIKKAMDEKSVAQSATGTKTDDKKDDPGKDGTGDKNLQHGKGVTIVSRNVFDQNGKTENQGAGSTGGGVAVGGTLSHSQKKALVATAIKEGTLKDAILAHVGEYGITNIEMLFPDAQTIDQRPEWITRRMEWVEGVLNGARKLPFSRIKSRSADLTHEEARAKGYIKANLKKEQFFAIAERETHPKTIYKKQRLDRDDIIDVTDFDLVSWLWAEMYFMIREECARAILVGDGREPDDTDKIDVNKIRPIAQDDEFYTDVIQVDANVSPSGLIEAVLRGRDKYKGTGPTAYMTNAVLVDMLLEKDGLGRRLYDTEEQLARALKVQKIVEVPVLEGQERAGGTIMMIIVNMSDYAIGATKGGELTKFDDFDIDYNQYKYLIEGRMSGALVKHKTAQVVIRGTGTLATPTVPSFNAGTGVITIPTVTGVTYRNQFDNSVLAAGPQDALDPGEVYNVKATPNTGYYFPHNFDNDWQFTRPA